MHIIKKLKYKTYMGTLRLLQIIFLFFLSLPLASFYTLGIKHIATILVLILSVSVFFFVPFRIFLNRKRLPVYSLDLESGTITTSKCHPKIIEMLRSHYFQRCEILLMSQKKFESLYPPKKMKTYFFDLKTYDKDSLYINHDWPATDHMHHGPFYSYQLIYAGKVISPLSKLMLLAMVIKGYIRLKIVDWIMVIILGTIDLMLPGLIIMCILSILLARTVSQ